MAVSSDGARLGKGGGVSDLEVAVEAGLIDEDTTVVTTVHEVQVREAGGIPLAPRDVRLDAIVTPERVLHCNRGQPADGIRWDELTEDKIASIPLLQRLRPEV